MRRASVCRIASACRIATFAALAVLALTPAAAYYHYVQYLTSSAPYSLALERFDLTALPDQTVTFFVSDSGPANYVTNDSFPSVLGQIRNATQVWNSVATSGLRVAFGGLAPIGTPHNVPSGEIEFTEMPPGLLAFAGPSSRAEMTQGPNGPFIPILSSNVFLNIDMTVAPGPSYLQSFFTTVVHEMGHAIGLQHTFTGATMSVAVMRATSRAYPLDVDDVASVSLLYPAAGFPLGYGSISGQVTTGGQGVHLASVVALLANGSAISGLTNPDGSYEIDGVPPGNCWVYAHPLPPTANIRFPIDVNGNYVPPSPPFLTSFYPGTTDPSQFGLVPVTAGNLTSGINFSVQPRIGVEMFDITPYSFPSAVAGQSGSTPVQPAFLNGSANIPVQTVVADGFGITSGLNAAPGLTVQVLTGPGQAPVPAYALEGYGFPNTALAIYLQYPAPPVLGPEHLLFALPDDIYVLPQGIRIVANQPPLASTIAPNGDGSVTLTGLNLAPDSQVFFDSLPGTVTVPLSVDGSSGIGAVSAMPPPGASSQVSTITVFNSDGQNSMALQSQSPLTYAYPQLPAPSANISVSGLPQGASSELDITTSSMQFVDGMTTLGFATGDVEVRRLWVVSPNHAIADVTVSPWAAQQTTNATVTSGFQVFEQPAAFQELPAVSGLPIIGLPVANALFGENSLYAGGYGAVYGLNLAAPNATPTITVGGVPASILYSSPNQINFLIPSSLPVGPAAMLLNNGAEYAYPIEVQIDPPPPVIASGPQAAAPGDIITLEVSGLTTAAIANPGFVAVAEGGVNLPSFSLQPATDGTGDILISVTLSQYLTGEQLPVVVSQNGDLSQPFLLNVAVSGL